MFDHWQRTQCVYVGRRICYPTSNKTAFTKGLILPRIGPTSLQTVGLAVPLIMTFSARGYRFSNALQAQMAGRFWMVLQTHLRQSISNAIRLVESAGRPHIYRNGKLVVLSKAGDPNRVNGGGWCRPASELNILRGSSGDGLTFPGPLAINVTNGEILGTYPHPYYGTDGTGQIYAFHTGGVTAVLVDGSTRFLSQSIDIRSLARLVTRNASEVSSDFE